MNEQTVTTEDLTPSQKAENFSQFERILKFFTYDHLPVHLQQVSKPFCELANKLTGLPVCAERSVALRKLLEAKDAAVRASLS